MRLESETEGPDQRNYSFVCNSLKQQTARCSICLESETRRRVDSRAGEDWQTGADWLQCVYPTETVLFRGRAMIRITKEADYGIMLLAHLAERPLGEVHAAREIARWSGLSVPMASKILRTLAQGKIITSHRGVSGGYSLDRSPDQTSVAEVIRAMDGPISMVQCGAEPGACDQEPGCLTRNNWARISREVERALERVPISEMIRRPETPHLIPLVQEPR